VNCTISGFMQAAAIAAILHRRLVLAAVLYTVAINHKQMLLYFAPAFFSTMLGACFVTGSSQRPRSAQAVRGVARVVALGLTVAGTVYCIWAPFLKDTSVAWKVRTTDWLPLEPGSSVTVVVTMPAQLPPASWGKSTSQVQPMSQVRS
jgi:ALG6, ALG8 glycosyltransferase family